MSDGFSPFWYWINERHLIYLRKTILEGKTPPKHYDPKGAIVSSRWSLTHLTDDPILHEYRFCNVFRELDRVTIWIRENISEPFKDHPNLWIMLAIARTINWPPTLKFLMSTSDFAAWPTNKEFSPSQLGAALDSWKERGEKIYTGAYMIRAESNPNAEWYSWTKQRYVAEIVLGRLWEDREQITAYLKSNYATVQGAWNIILKDDRYIGWGPFMTFQWVLDMRHTPILEGAHDASSWAAIGPGSLRGLNRLHGRPILTKLSQEQALAEMRELLTLSRTNLKPHLPKLEMEDIQNSLCETDKYLRVKLSNGRDRPRSKYVVGRGY